MYPFSLPLQYFPVSKLEIISCDFPAEQEFRKLTYPVYRYKVIKVQSAAADREAFYKAIETNYFQNYKLSSMTVS